MHIYTRTRSHTARIPYYLEQPPWSAVVSNKPFVFQDSAGARHGVYLARAPNTHRGILCFSAIAHVQLKVIRQPYNIDQDSMEKMLANGGSKVDEKRHVHQVDEKRHVHPFDEKADELGIRPCGPYTSVNWNFTKNNLSNKAPRTPPKS